MYNRKLAKLLTHSYKILAVILILLAGGLLLLPTYEKHEGIDPESLLANSISPERYISSDELAHKIISGDPSLLVIDVRDSARFSAYSIPGAVNIPLANVLDEESEVYLDQSAYEIVLCSDDSFYADQAWILCNRLGYKNLRVLDGGMHAWFNSVITSRRFCTSLTKPLSVRWSVLSPNCSNQVKGAGFSSTRGFFSAASRISFIAFCTSLP